LSGTRGDRRIEIHFVSEIRLDRGGDEAEDVESACAVTRELE